MFDPNHANFSLMLTIGLIFIVVYTIVYVIINWFLFKKAGQPAWAALIPVYDMYIFQKIAGLKIYWLIAVIIFYAHSTWLVIIFVNAVVSNDIYYFFGKNFLVLQLSQIFLTLFYVLWAFISVGLARRFGRKEEFAIGIFFLIPIFLGILAFNKRIRYQAFSEKA